MIAFGSSITSEDVYARCAEPGIRRASEPDSAVLARPASGTIFASYNHVLDEAAELDDLEALVLLHQDAEIVDPRFCSKLREALADPDVGVVGCVGAIGVRNIDWWDGSITWASFSHRYPELGGGELPSLTWDDDDLPPFGQLGEVDTVDGFVLALSPWVVRNVRFDESLGHSLHGYDFDFCLQVRAAGRKIATADFKLIHHHSLVLGSDLDQWARAHVSVAEKWDGRMPDVGVAPGDWKQRARRAEADAAMWRAQEKSWRLKVAALGVRHQNEQSLMTTSIGWRLTAPLRRVQALRRTRRAAPAPARDSGGDASGTVIGRRLRRPRPTEPEQ